MVATLLAAMNAFLAAILAYYSWKCPPDKCVPWVRIPRTIIGVYWCVLYIFVVLAEPGSYNVVLFGQLFVRPAFTLTLALMAVSVVGRYKANL